MIDAQWITVAARENEDDSHQAGLQILVKDGEQLPDVILINGYALTYRDILDDGVPLYVVAKLYVWRSEDLPKREFLMPGLA